MASGWPRIGTESPVLPPPAGVMLAGDELREAAMELFSLVSSMAAERSQAGLAERCLHAACRLTAAPSGVLYVLDATGRALVPMAGRSNGISALPSDPVPLYPRDQPDMRDPRTWCTFTGRVATVVDVGVMHGFDGARIVRRDAQQRTRTTSLIALPLRGNDDLTVGVLELSNLEIPAAREHAAEFLQSLVPPLQAFAYQAAIAISNLGLLKRNQELVEEINRHVCELRDENLQLRRRTLSVASNAGGIVTRSPAMQTVLDQVAKAADSSVAVLVLGETGTGKEMIARLVHSLSPRHAGPFVPQNCAALPADLLESELFGYRKGAFSGAVADKKGLFETAHGGTLFLDEIGDMPLPLQTKLLRVLQDGEVRPLGAVEGRRFDVRIVAATNADLRARAAEGRFREDLFYRIAVFPVRLPPLRDRADDIVLLAEHFLSVIAAQHGKSVAGLGADAAAALRAYPFPGNVRELRNVIERAIILCSPGRPLAAADLPAELDRPSFPVKPDADKALRHDLRRWEARAIEDALAANGGNRTQAASTLGMSRRSLQEKIARYGLGRVPT